MEWPRDSVQLQLRRERVRGTGDTADLTAYAYDGLGNRIQQTVGANVTQYLLDLQPGLALVLSETTGANVIRNVHALRGIHAHKDAGGAWEWMVQDGLGSVRGVVDNTVEVLWSGNYGSYGDPFDTTGSSQTNYGFTGEPMDDNGLLYLRARYYNPAAGVFTALDPFEGMSDRAMSLNGYSWVEGNVPNAVDPSGMIYELPSMWAACSGVGDFTFILQPGDTPTPTATVTPCPTAMPTSTPTPGTPTPTPGTPAPTPTQVPFADIYDKVRNASVIVMFGKNSSTCNPDGLDNSSSCVADGAAMGTLTNG